MCACLRVLTVRSLASASCPHPNPAAHQDARIMKRSVDAASMLSGDDLSDYDVISDGHRSLESSIADLSHVDVEAADIHEPPPPPAARDRFDTVSLSADDIQKYVRKAVPSIPGRRWSGDGTVRVYVDGIFDPFQAR